MKRARTDSICALAAFGGITFGCAFPPAPKPAPVMTGVLSSSSESGSITGVTEITVSGDGKVLVFCGGRSNELSGQASAAASQLYLLDVVTQTVSHLTVDAGGRPADGSCFGASISRDGQRVAFLSDARNLCEASRAVGAQVLLYDRGLDQFTCASGAVDGAPADGPCSDVSLSADGSTLAFSSRATNLLGLDENGISYDLNGRADVFAKDMATGFLERVSVTVDGFQALRGHSFGAAISRDGQLIAFASDADNLVPHDENGVADIFVHDRRTHETRRVVSVTGMEANGASGRPVVSADGEWVAFESAADNMARSDLNSGPDILLYEVATRDVRLCSVDEAGAQLAEGGARPTISGDGRYVGFEVLRTKRLFDGRNYVDGDVLIYDRGTGATRGLDADDAAPLLRPCASLLCPLPLRTQAPSLSADGGLLGYLASHEDVPSAYWLMMRYE